MLLLQLLFLMTCFVLVGEPLRAIFSRWSRLFQGLDILQILILDTYLGGFVLYVVAIFPLSFFSKTSALMLTLVFGAFSLYLNRDKFLTVKKSVDREALQNISAYLGAHKHSLLKGIAVSAMFLVVLWMQIMPMSDFLLGSIHDTSLHALFVRLILENGHIPATHEPYLAAAIIYPQGSQVIFAYSSYILGFIPAKAVFCVSPLFTATSVLAAYYLGRRIHPSGHIDVFFAFVMAFVSMWPRYITWGSNPFIVGFPLFFICLSFFPSFSDTLDKKRLSEIAIVGILFGYLASIHLAFYEVVIVSATIWLLAVSSSKSIKIRKFANFFIACALSLLIVAPFVYRFVKYYEYPGHNIGLPQDMVADVTSPPSTTSTSPHPPFVSILTNFPTWLASNYNIHPDPALRTLWIGLVLAGFLTVFLLIWRRVMLFDAERIVLVVLGASILLDLSTYILPAIPWGRISHILYVSLCLLIASFSIRLHSNLRAFVHRLFHRIVNGNKKKATLTGFLPSLLLLSALYLPFVYYTITCDPGNFQNLYNLYAVTTESDYEVMIWMKHNVSSNATILVSPYECGGFIPSVSQKKTVFPFSAYFLSHSYRTLIDLIQQEVTNKTTYDLMSDLKITHVFLGSQAVQLWGKSKLEENPKWDPLLFIGNPNFRMLKNVGETCVFSVAYENPEIFFQEDFEHLSLTQMGWRFTEMGTGGNNFTVVHKNDDHLLRVVAERNASSRWLYACWMNRKIYLPTNLNVRLSFYLNASDVDAPNTVAVSIFDIGRERHLTFATPSALYTNQRCVVELKSNCGNFSFNVSEVWELNFGEPLPNIIMLELAAVNVDNASSTVTYFDDITVTTDQ